MPPQPPKRGSLFIVPQSIRPQLVRTGIEVRRREILENQKKKIDCLYRFLLGEFEI